MVNKGLRQPRPDGFVQASEFCERVTGALLLDPGSGRDQAAAVIGSATSNAGTPLNLSVQEWDNLFRAIQERVRRIGGERDTGTVCVQMHDLGGSIQDAVLECAAALGQLHEALALEYERVRIPAAGCVDTHGKS